MKIARFVLLFFLLLKYFFADAQQPYQDSNYISHFDRTNIIELVTGINATNYNFNGLKKDTSSFRLAANSNAYAGFNFNYKWISVNYSFAIPGTLLDEKVRLKHISASFRYNHRQWSFVPFYNFYNGLLLQNNRDHREFDPFRNMNFYDGGLKIFYFTNSSTYSYRSGNSFREQQLKKAGSFILMAIPRWQKINWKTPNEALVNDSSTYRLLSSDPQWFSLTLGGGYTYNFTFHKGKWIIAPALIVGAGALKELQRNGYVQPVFNLQTWLNAGYNGYVFYSFISTNWQNTQTKLITKKMNGINRGVSLTLGYRFKSYPKKIFKML